VVGDQPPHSRTASRLQALFHSLCRVLCTFRSLYFCAIGSGGHIEAEQVSNCRDGVHAVLSNSTTPGSDAVSREILGTTFELAILPTGQQSHHGTVTLNRLAPFQARIGGMREGCPTKSRVARYPANMPQHNFLWSRPRNVQMVPGRPNYWRPRRSPRPRPSPLSSFPLQTDMLKFRRWLRRSQASRLRFQCFSIRVHRRVCFRVTP
jgi:hypothetical protein